jgi:hypothetical protein
VSGLFKDLSTSLARFVYAWLVPSATAVAAFSVLVLPDLRRATGSAGSGVNSEPLTVAGLFAIAVLLLSIVFAYTSLPIYRTLEGYTLPGRLQRRLLKRRLREWYRLRALADRRGGSATDRGKLLERLAAYPNHAEDVMPTRLGNALRALERYGVDRFGLDSQSLWYELLAVTPDNLRRDAEDARASVDFFLSAIAHLTLLATVSAGVAIVSGGLGSALVAVVSLSLIPVAYNGAVLNVGESRAAVQAVVNTGRFKLPVALGLRLPSSFADERELWTAYRSLVAYGDHDELLDENRASHRMAEAALAGVQGVGPGETEAAGAQPSDETAAG